MEKVERKGALINDFFYFNPINTHEPWLGSMKKGDTVDS